MQLSGRTILITGGASGLGGATVDMVVAQGGRAVVIDVNEDAGRAKEASHRGAVRFVKGDVTAEADVQRAIDVAIELGGLHGVVNAAGIPAAERVLPEGWRSAALAFRTGHPRQSRRDVQRHPARRRGHGAESADRRRRARRHRQHGIGGRVRRTDRTGGVFRLKGRHRGDDAADRARVRPHRRPRDDHCSGDVRHAAPRRRCPTRRGNRSPSRFPFPRASVVPRNTRRSSATCSRTRC